MIANGLSCDNELLTHMNQVKTCGNENKYCSKTFFFGFLGSVRARGIKFSPNIPIPFSFHGFYEFP